MANLITTDNFRSTLSALWGQMTDAQRAAARPYLAETCALSMDAAPRANGMMLPEGGDGALAELLRRLRELEQRCGDNAMGGMGGYTPFLNVPGCPVNCDPCAFPALDTDTRLYSWPQIEAEMWDTDTKINVVLQGTFPLPPGSGIVLGQELRRAVTWIPECVQISTTWVGSPQPGELEYQWATGPKSGPGLTGQVNFSNVQNGQQYEAGPTPGTTATVFKVPFPTYKGCDSMAIGALSNLRLIVALRSSATSTLQSLIAIAYHKKSASGCAKNKCAPGGSCKC